MAIIVMLVAISIGSMKLFFADQGTVSDSDRVRGKLALARSYAIDQGTPYTFGVVWNQSNWRVAPEDSWDSGSSPDQDTIDGQPIELGKLQADSRFVEASASS